MFDFSHSGYASHSVLLRQAELLSEVGLRIGAAISPSDEAIDALLARLSEITDTVSEKVASANDDLLQVADAVDVLLELMDNAPDAVVSNGKLHTLIAPLKGRLDAVSRDIGLLV
ncbi:hypothetical protein PTE30175_01997 [Pandoraea terrae]|uniref:Chemotaxis protein n=1 Tax=Pandoraea terrae TaxID=1537710 RepID=A0A5E4UIJ7_9BURK|nr:DUF1484 family protein [Pandoraea terrae]VVD99850.1 hypothetical protein PTE30175_01997 [Pandoraea terrae]